MRLGETPVPIPNTMVKTQAADGTALETVWESRWLPELKKSGERQDRKRESFLRCGCPDSQRIDNRNRSLSNVYLENCIPRESNSRKLLI